MRYISHLVLTGVAASFLMAGQASAQKTKIEAQVKGADGKPAQGAGVQIERQDKKSSLISGQTDGRGRFVNENLDAGTYKLTVLVAGAPPQTQVVTTAAKKPVLVTLDMKTVAGASAPTKKVYVWVEPSTGSHMGGHFEERNAAKKAAGPGMQNVESVSAGAIQRPQYLPSTGSR